MKSLATGNPPRRGGTAHRIASAKKNGIFGQPHRHYLVSIHKWSFCPISALREKNNPRNIRHMPVVIFFACLDLEQKSRFMDGHYLAPERKLSFCQSLRLPVRSPHADRSDKNFNPQNSNVFLRLKFWVVLNV